MKRKILDDHFTTHAHWLVIVIGYLLIIVFVLRRINDLESPLNQVILWPLAAFLTALYTVECFFSPALNHFTWIYMVVQTVIVQILGLFQEYQDTWLLLYIVLAFQAARMFRRAAAAVWFVIFISSGLVTLLVEFGLILGIGRAMAYIVIGVLLVSYDIQFAQHEDALAESQILLEELQEAHDKLAAYAGQTAILAAIEVRNRMFQELHETIVQKILVIQQSVKNVRQILPSDFQKASVLIADLCEQTQSALSQMRRLIDQWRNETDISPSDDP